LGRRPVTDVSSAVGPTMVQRWRTIKWVLLALLVIALVSAVTTYLTAPRPGGRMDPESTSPDGARALVSLLRDQGVDLIEAATIADVERAARPDALLVVAETYFPTDDEGLRRLSAVPGDRLLVEPASRTRAALSPAIRIDATPAIGGSPNCDMPEANHAGEAQFGGSDTYDAADDTPVTRCYDGAVVRYADAGRTVTVVGSADFMTNSGLLKEGNAALAMNLAGTRPRVVWYAPQQFQGESSGGSASLVDLMPDRVGWIVLQLCLAVLLVALWRGRRIGPLVAEDLPVVVRASETVEGRGRLYRSRRARDRAADALRGAARARMLPRLGLGANAEPTEVTQAIAQRVDTDPNTLAHILFGPPPDTDAELIDLARQLDDIERQVALS
jgi:uncharacterized protein DUF4350